MLQERNGYKLFVRKHIGIEVERNLFSHIEERIYTVFKKPFEDRTKVEKEFDVSTGKLKDIDKKTKEILEKLDKHKLGNVVVNIFKFETLKKSYKALPEESKKHISEMEKMGIDHTDLVAGIISFSPLENIDPYPKCHQGKGVGGKVLDDVLMDLKKSSVKFAYVINPKPKMENLLFSRGFKLVESSKIKFKAYLKKLE